MSIKRMNIEEKARYLIGEAIMRRILKSERTPEIQAEIESVLHWVETWLHDEELVDVTVGTGIIFDEDFAKQLRGDVNGEPSKGGDDDIPF
jgi:hypothetical protein